tara:strand:+ start:231 stop:476 length:246 start_codon:yes stop_codon:yes gene_type:complete
MNFFETFFLEKNLTDEVYTVISNNGTPNIIPSTVVIEAVKRTKGEEAKKIETILRKIDFLNGDVHDFLKHLAQGLALDTDF